MDGYIIPAGTQVPAPFPFSAVSMRVVATGAASSTAAPIPCTPPRANTSRIAGQDASSRSPPGSVWAPATPVNCGAAPSVAGTPKTQLSVHTCTFVPRPVNTPRRGATCKSTDRPPQGVCNNVRTTLPGNMGVPMQATTSVWPVPLHGVGHGVTGPGRSVYSSRQTVGAKYGDSGRVPGWNASVIGNVKTLGGTATALPGTSTTPSLGLLNVATLGSTNNILQSNGLNRSETCRTANASTAFTSPHREGHGFVEPPATPSLPQLVSLAESLITSTALDCTTDADPSTTCRFVKLTEANSGQYPPKNCGNSSKEPLPPSPLAPHNEKAEPAAVVCERKLRPHLYHNYPTRGVYA